MKDMIKYLEFIESTRKLSAGSPKDKQERLLSLASETGELLQLYKKKLRDGTTITTQDLMSEMGDVLYSICAIISMEGYTVHEVVNFNQTKLKNRGMVKL